MGVKMNLRIITKNHVADPEKKFITKFIPKPYGRATALPTASELKSRSFLAGQYPRQPKFSKFQPPEFLRLNKSNWTEIMR